MDRSYPMSEADRAIQAAARTLADELLPHEVEAELHGGELPDGLLEAHRRRVAELGFEAINMPKELGGGGFTAFQQVLVQEQIGRVTNALGWVVHTPASWLPKVASQEQLDRWVLPTIRGERRECYAITEEGAGSDVDAIQATATREGDDYVLNGVKWHVTSFNHADHVFFQGKLAGGANAGAHAMFVLDLDTPRRWPGGWPTGRCRCSGAAATCGRTSPSASTASCGWTGSGRAPRRSSGRSSPTSSPSGASAG